MKLRQALIEQSPSLALQRAAAIEIAALDHLLDQCYETLCEGSYNEELADKLIEWKESNT